MPKIFTTGIFSEGGRGDFKQLCNRAEVSSDLDKGRRGAGVQEPVPSGSTPETPYWPVIVYKI